MTTISHTVSYAAVQDRLGLTFSDLLCESTSGAIVDLIDGQAHGSKDRISGSDRRGHQDDKDDKGESELHYFLESLEGVGRVVVLCFSVRYSKTTPCYTHNTPLSLLKHSLPSALVRSLSAFVGYWSMLRNSARPKDLLARPSQSSTGTSKRVGSAPQVKKRCTCWRSACNRVGFNNDAIKKEV